MRLEYDGELSFLAFLPLVAFAYSLMVDTCLGYRSGSDRKVSLT